MFNQLSASLCRWQFVEPLLLAIEYSDACGTVHFVGGKAEKIAVELMYVDRHMRDGLRAVDTHRNALRMRQRDYLADRVDDTQHIAHMGDTHELGAVVNKCPESIHVQ